MQLEVQGYCESFGVLKHGDLMNLTKSILALEKLLRISLICY